VIRAGCRWISLREKDLSEDGQIALVEALLPIAWRHGARVSLHGDPALAKVANADGVHLSARSDPIAARKLLGADKLIGVSIHTVTEAEAIACRNPWKRAQRLEIGKTRTRISSGELLNYCRLQSSSSRVPRRTAGAGSGVRAFDSYQCKAFV
jgi:hypothetical protein